MFPMSRAALPTLLLFAAAACSREASPPTMTAAPLVPDIHSFARPAEARVTAVALDLQANFDTHVLQGRATLTFVRRPDAKDLVLDTRGLQIAQVLDDRQQPLTFRLEPAVEHLGQALVVTLPKAGDRIVIEYRTSPDAAALQWLTPAQTAGRIHPYLYSQGQAILTRTWIPTQDSPGIRQTFEATHHRAAAAARRDVGRDADARWRRRGQRPAGVPLQDGPAGAAVPDRDRGRRHRVPVARALAPASTPSRRCWRARRANSTTSRR